MNDIEFILGHLERIAMNLEELVSFLAPPQSAIYVDKEQQVNFISMEDAMKMLEAFENNSASEMIGKTDYIVAYDASRKLIIDGEAYLSSGYLVMKSNHGLQGLDEDDISAVLQELRSRICILALGQYRIQTYRLG